MGHEFNEDTLLRFVENLREIVSTTTMVRVIQGAGGRIESGDDYVMLELPAGSVMEFPEDVVSRLIVIRNCGQGEVVVGGRALGSYETARVVGVEGAGWVWLDIKTGEILEP